MSFFYTVLTIIPLAVIVVTALFGLADVRPVLHAIRHDTATFDMILGAFFICMGLGGGFLCMSVMSGSHTVTLAGLLLLYGIAGVFFMIGHYAPWRLWIKSRERTR